MKPEAANPLIIHPKICLFMALTLWIKVHIEQNYNIAGTTEYVLPPALKKPHHLFVTLFL